MEGGQGGRREHFLSLFLAVLDEYLNYWCADVRRGWDAARRGLLGLRVLGLGRGDGRTCNSTELRSDLGWVSEQPRLRRLRPPSEVASGGGAGASGVARGLPVPLCNPRADAWVAWVFASAEWRVVGHVVALRLDVKLIGELASPALARGAGDARHFLIRRGAHGPRVGRAVPKEAEHLARRTFHRFSLACAVLDCCACIRASGRRSFRFLCSPLGPRPDRPLSAQPIRSTTHKRRKIVLVTSQVPSSNLYTSDPCLTVRSPSPLAPAMPACLPPKYRPDPSRF